MNPLSSSIISFIPQDRRITRKSVRRIPILRIRLKVRKVTIARFSVFNGKLDVTFHCPEGYHIFLKKKKVKRFLRRNIKLPPEVGLEIVHKERNIVCEVACNSCDFIRCFPRQVTVVGTEVQATGPIEITDPDWSHKCPRCRGATICTIRSV